MNEKEARRSTANLFFRKRTLFSCLRVKLMFCASMAKFNCLRLTTLGLEESQLLKGLLAVIAGKTKLACFVLRLYMFPQLRRSLLQWALWVNDSPSSWWAPITCKNEMTSVSRTLPFSSLRLDGSGVEVKTSSGMDSLPLGVGLPAAVTCDRALFAYSVFEF